MHHVHAETVSFSIEKPSVNIWVIVTVSHKYIGKQAVYIDDDRTQHRCHQDGLPILSHRVNDVLQL